MNIPNEPEPLVDFTATKKWVGGPAAKPVITVKLFNDDVEFDTKEITTTAGSANATYTWNDLDATDMTGKAYVYTVDEVAVPENYTKRVEGNTITNTYVPKRVNLTVTKVWKGTALAEVEVMVYANGEEIAKVTITEKTGWKHEFIGLPLTDEQGKEIHYTVKEPPIKGYTSSVTGDLGSGFVVTNTQDKPPVPPAPPKKRVPRTGEEPMMILPLLASALAGAIFYRKKRLAD